MSTSPTSKTHAVDIERAIRTGRYGAVRQADVGSRVAAIRTGFHTRITIEKMTSHMSIPKERLYKTLGLPRATIVRKMATDALMSSDESERLLGLADLIGQVQNMVKRSGDPKDFDAAHWLASWLEQPLPALGGKAPAEWMDTADGRRLVSDVLARIESGAYT